MRILKKRFRHHERPVCDIEYTSASIARMPVSDPRHPWGPDLALMEPPLIC